jgi:hypothetical protein
MSFTRVNTLVAIKAFAPTRLHLRGSSEREQSDGTKSGTIRLADGTHGTPASLWKSIEKLMNLSDDGGLAYPMEAAPSVAVFDE